MRTAREVLLAILIAWALVISQTTPHVTDHVQCASTDTYSPQGDTLHADEGNRRVQLCEMFMHQTDGNFRVYPSLFWGTECIASGKQVSALERRHLSRRRKILMCGLFEHPFVLAESANFPYNSVERG